MDTNNNNWDFFKQNTDKLDWFIDKFNWGYYINKFENLEIVKSIKSLSFFNIINSFFATNFDIITKIFWILGIIGGILWIAWVFQYFMLLSFISSIYGIFSIVNFLGMIFSCIMSFVQWFGLVYNKKWIPFVSLVYFFLSMCFYLISIFINFSPFIISSVFSFVISFLIGFFILTIVINNKSKFGTTSKSEHKGL